MIPMLLRNAGRYSQTWIRQWQYQQKKNLKTKKLGKENAVKFWQVIGQQTEQWETGVLFNNLAQVSGRGINKGIGSLWDPFLVLVIHNGDSVPTHSVDLWNDDDQALEVPGLKQIWVGNLTF